MKLFIPIILGSTRRDRESGKVAAFAHRRLSRYSEIETELIDLKDLDLPVMEERLRYRDDPPPGLTDFAARIERADGILVVSPEYNHGYPGVLKNALDYLLPEYERKPFGFVTVSAGGFGGIQCLTQLQQIVIGMGAFPIPDSFSVSKVQESFRDDGTPVKESLNGRFDEFAESLIWFAEAIRRQKERVRASDASPSLRTEAGPAPSTPDFGPLYGAGD